MPPGRTVMLVKSESGAGLSTRATEERWGSFAVARPPVSPVRDDMPVRVVPRELSSVVTMDRAPRAEPPVAPLGGAGGVTYSSGSGT